MINSKDEAVLARFVGAATIDQFHEFLESGRNAATGSMAAADWWRGRPADAPIGAG